MRWEHSQQHVNYATDGGEKYAERLDLNGDDLFPALNLKYQMPANHTLRLALSRTVTRPSFIEKAPFLYQEPETTLGYDCDCLIEADNNENNYQATPVSHPVLSDLLLVGNSSANGNRGIRLRRGTQVEISGAKVSGKGNAVTLESEETENALKNGTSKLLNMQVDSDLKSEKGIYTNDDFLAAGNKVDAQLTFANWSAVKSAATWISGSWVK